jgi:multidrug resistance efflux pump
MPAGFSRSLRALEDDGFRGATLGLCLAAALLAAWTTWFLTAPVARYETSERARIEVDRAGYSVQAPLDGRVIASRLALGRVVEAGEVLVELESEPERLQIQEQRARLAAIEPQLESLKTVLAAQEQSAVNDRQACEAALAQARAQLREAEAFGALAKQQAERLRQLHAEGLAAEADYLRAASEVESRGAAAAALEAAVKRLDSEYQRSAGDRLTEMRRIRSDMTRLEGDRQAALRTVERLEFEAARRSIRSPAAGRLGEVAVLRSGAYVEQGQALCTVIPASSLRVIADFAPSAALGRIRPQQPALLRLDGFPWTQYGAIGSTVVSVAAEVRDGKVRVELAIDNPGTTAIPLQHGMPGAVEVQVESVTPAVLALRAAGQMLARTGAAAR